MKNNIFNMLIVLTISMISTFSHAHFGSKGPYGGGKITSTVQASGIVYFGTETGGVYASTNSSLVGWSCKPVGLKSPNVTGLAHNGTLLFCSTADSGVFRWSGLVGSDRYWENINTGITDKNTSTIVSINANTLIVGTNSGKLFKTIDAGATWTEILSLPFTNSRVSGIVIAGTRIIATVENKGIFYSDNNGDNWSSLNDGNTANISGTSALAYNATTDELMVKNNNGLLILSLASTSTSPSSTIVNTGLPLNISIRNISNSSSKWYISTDNGVYQSVTGSISWSSINNGNTNLNVNFVTIAGTTLIAGIYKDGIIKTDEATINWTTVNTGFNNQATYAMATSGDQVIVAATEKGLFVSKNLATSYTASNNGLTDYLHVNDLTFKGTKLFAVTENAGVFVSNDTGAVWNPFNTGLTQLNVKKVFASNNYVYVFDADGNLFQSNGTGSWTLIQGNLGENLEDISLTFYNNKVIAGIQGDGVHVRNETNGIWENVTNNLLTDHVTAITTLGNKVYAGTHMNGVFVADLSNFNWTACAPLSISHTTLMHLDGSSVQALNTFGGYVFASYKGGLLATNNYGQTWVQGGNQFNYPSFSDVNKICFVTSRVFVTTENNCLYSNALSEVAVNIAINYPSSPSCNNSTDGTLSAVYTGGTSPYTFLWSTGATTSTITNVGIGTYYVTVTDAINATHTDSITITAPSPIVPTASISSNGNQICPGDEVTFTINGTNQGDAPTYEWFVEGVSVSTNDTLMTTTLANLNEVYCVITNNAICVTTTEAISDTITISVSTAQTPSVTFSGLSSICEGNLETYTATPVAVGTNPIYIWYVNDVEQNETTAIFEANNLANNDVISCSLISSLTCATADTVNSSQLSITVNEIPTTPIVTVNGTELSSSEANGNQWYLNSNAISNATSQIFNVVNNGQYYVNVTENGCTSANSSIVAFATLAVNQLENGTFAVFPNPTIGAFNIQTSDALIQSVVIANEVGAVVEVLEGSNSNFVNVNTNLEKGIYVLKISTSKGEKIERITIQ